MKIEDIKKASKLITALENYKKAGEVKTNYDFQASVHYHSSYNNNSQQAIDISIDIPPEAWKLIEEYRFKRIAEIEKEIESL